MMGFERPADYRVERVSEAMWKVIGDDGQLFGECPNEHGAHVLKRFRAYEYDALEGRMSPEALLNAAEVFQRYRFRRFARFLQGRAEAMAQEQNYW